MKSLNNFGKLFRLLVVRMEGFFLLLREFFAVKFYAQDFSAVVRKPRTARVRR